MEGRQASVGYLESCGKPSGVKIDARHGDFRPPARTRSKKQVWHDRLFEDAEIMAERQREAQEKFLADKRAAERVEAERLDMKLAKEKQAALRARGRESVHDRLHEHAALLAARRRHKEEEAQLEKLRAEEETLQVTASMSKGKIGEREASQFYARLHKDSAEKASRLQSAQEQASRDEAVARAKAVHERIGKPKLPQASPVRSAKAERVEKAFRLQSAQEKGSGATDTSETRAQGLSKASPDRSALPKRETRSIHDRLYAEKAEFAQRREQLQEKGGPQKHTPVRKPGGSRIFDRLYKEKELRDQKRDSIYMPDTKDAKEDAPRVPEMKRGSPTVHERLYREQEHIAERRRILADKADRGEAGKRQTVPGHPACESRRSTFLPWEESRDQCIARCVLESPNEFGGELGATEFQIWTPRPDEAGGDTAAHVADTAAHEMDSAPQPLDPAESPGKTKRWNLLLENAM